MLKAWTSPNGFRHEGRFWTLNVPRLRPTPYTKPHPYRDPRGVVRGRRAAPRAPRPALPDERAVARDHAEAPRAYRADHGRVPASTPRTSRAAWTRSWVWRNVVVAETDEEARRIGMPAFEAMQEHRKKLREKIYAEQGIIMKKETVPPARVNPDLALIAGSPATVAARMAEIEATGVGGVICSFRLGPMPAEVAARSIRLFMEQVAPRFTPHARCRPRRNSGASDRSGRPAPACFPTEPLNKRILGRASGPVPGFRMRPKAQSQTVSHPGPARIRANGRAMSQTSPASGQRRSTLPPSWPVTVASITRDPTPRLWGSRGGAAGLGPADTQQPALLIGLPGDRHAPGRRRQRAMLRRIGREFVDHHAERLHRLGAQAQRRPVQHESRAVAAAPSSAPPKGASSSAQQGAERRAGPALRGEQRLRARQRRDAALDQPRIAGRILGAGQAQDRLHDRERVARAVVHLLRQQVAPVLGLAPLGDVAVGAGQAQRQAGRGVAAHHRGGALDPAPGPVGALEAIFDPVARHPAGRHLVPGRAHARAVGRVDARVSQSATAGLRPIRGQAQDRRCERSERVVMPVARSVSQVPKRPASIARRSRSSPSRSEAVRSATRCSSPASVTPSARCCR